MGLSYSSFGYQLGSNSKLPRPRAVYIPSTYVPLKLLRAFRREGHAGPGVSSHTSLLPYEVAISDLAEGNEAGNARIQS